MQRPRLLAAFSRCGLPLYLKLAFEEARGWASYVPSEERLLGEGVEGLTDTLLNRLSLEANHGPLLVARGLGSGLKYKRCCGGQGPTATVPPHSISEDPVSWVSLTPLVAAHILSEVPVMCFKMARGGHFPEPSRCCLPRRSAGTLAGGTLVQSGKKGVFT